MGINVELSKIKELIDLVNESGITELEVQHGDERVRIARASTSAPVAPAPVAPTPPVAPDAQPKAPPAPGSVIAAPLSGTFYRAPAPGEKPFVEIGDRVAVGEVLCIIESMKMMNRVKSERAGEVTAVLLEDGQPIESGTGLFRIL